MLEIMETRFNANVLRGCFCLVLVLGELVTYKQLVVFNPLPQFSRLGILCPALVNGFL